MTIKLSDSTSCFIITNLSTSLSPTLLQTLIIIKASWKMWPNLNLFCALLKCTYFSVREATKRTLIRLFSWRNTWYEWVQYCTRHLKVLLSVFINFLYSHSTKESHLEFEILEYLVTISFILKCERAQLQTLVNLITSLFSKHVGKYRSMGSWLL